MTLTDKVKVKVCFYIAQYPSIGPLTMIYTLILGRHFHSDINSASSNAEITRNDYSLTFSPPSLVIYRYSFIQLSELGHRRENENP